MQLNELKNDIEVYETFGAFTETHEAIAAFRIQHLKSSVLQNRVFLTEISDIYSLVKSFYILAQQGNLVKPEAKGEVIPEAGAGKPPVAKETKKGLFDLFKKDPNIKIDPRSLTFLKKNGRNISVLLSSNTGFYGGILKNLFDDFIDYIGKNKGDIAIVGRAGKEFYDHLAAAGKVKLDGKFYFFDLDDEHPTDEQMAKIINFAKDYDQIIVHYVQFFSVLTQIPYYSNIAGEVGLVGEADKNQLYSFEPSYEDILIFFETQILEAVFRQKVYEHQLARYGAKLVAMDDAVTSSRAEAKKLDKRRVRLKKQLLNKKQQEVLSALLGGYQDY